MRHSVKLEKQGLEIDPGDDHRDFEPEWFQ